MNEAVASGAPIGQLLEAAHFAAGKHRDQRRKDAHASPYINHPLGVAYLLWKEGGVTDLATLQVSERLSSSALAPGACRIPRSLQAALLHDTLEDTATEEAELVALCGEEVAAIVQECSDDKALPKWQRKKHQVRVATSLQAMCEGSSV